MSLAPGVRLGPYQVIALLGAGGMGEVYRATDTRLGRDVALKLLPPEFASDPDRLARFEREAKLLASLQHSNVATLFGLEESDGRRLLAMELVPGEDLAERVKRGPIPADEAVGIARQIAEALEEAHEHGIVHRDLKPANVKLAPDGKVKVLDFGLAKAWSGDGGAVSGSGVLSQSPTLAHTGTGAGIILGTAAYMSPEQARGKPVDKRADIWAFGVVLFEMLTGRRLFDGETVTDVLAAVVTREPDFASLPAATPAGVRQLLERSLRKDPKRRLRDIGDARIALEDAATGEEARSAGGPGVGAQTKPLAAWRRGLPWAVAAVAIALAGIGYLRSPSPAPPPLRKLKLPVRELRAGTPSPPELSPDGRRIVYVAGDDLWLRELAELEPRRLVASVAPTYPMWSPDSAQVAYIADQKLWRVSATGGVPVLVADASFPRGGFSPGGVWLSDDTIVFAPAANGTGLVAVPARGGAFALLHAAAPNESDFHKPSQLPGGRGILFVVDPNEGVSDTIDVLAGGTRKTVLKDPGKELNAPVYSPSGHLLYVRGAGDSGSDRNNAIWAVPFSLERLEATGAPFPVAQQARWPSVGADGTLVYAEPLNPQLELVWLAANAATPRAIGPASGYLRSPSLSPDGARVAAVGAEGVFVRELRRSAYTRLTFDDNVYREVAWHPDGRSVLYRAAHGSRPVEVVMKPADGSGDSKTLALGEAPSVSRDGKWLLFERVNSGTAGDLFYEPLDKSAPLAPFLEGPDHDAATAFSPDGRFVAIATQAQSSDRFEIVIRRFPRGDGVWQVSANGGAQPRWNGKGDRLFYRQGNDLMEVEVALGTTPQLGAPRLRIAGGPARLRLDFGFDAARDGRGFVAIRELPDPEGSVPTLTVVQSWFEEFRTSTGSR